MDTKIRELRADEIDAVAGGFCVSVSVKFSPPSVSVGSCDNDGPTWKDLYEVWAATGRGLAAASVGAA